MKFWVFTSCVAMFLLGACSATDFNGSAKTKSNTPSESTDAADGPSDDAGDGIDGDIDINNDLGKTPPTDGTDDTTLESDGDGVTDDLIESGNDGEEDTDFCDDQTEIVHDQSFGDLGNFTSRFAVDRPGIIEDSLILSDGKILLAGFLNSTTSEDTAVVRLTIDGELDATFGEGGISILGLVEGNVADRAEAIALDDNQKVIVAGKHGSNTDLYRLNADGTIDQTFGDNGLATHVILPGGTTVGDVIVLADQKILLLGKNLVDGMGSFVVARFNSNGSLDTTFGTNGFTYVATANKHLQSHRFIRTTAKIYAVGSERRNNAGSPIRNDKSVIVALNDDGSFDTDFADNGVLRVEHGVYSDSLHTVLPQGDKLLVGGYINNATGSQSAGDDFLVARYTKTGQLDTSYGSSGIFKFEYSDNVDRIQDMIYDHKNRLVILGEATIEGNHRTSIMRLDPEGAIDTTFNGSGQYGETLGSYTRIHQLESGKYILTGSSLVSFSVVRLCVLKD